MYTPQRLVAEHREMEENENLLIYQNHRRKVNGIYVAEKDWDGLMELYDQALDIAEISPEYKTILRTMPIQEYEASLLSSLQRAAQKAHKTDTVKAIYFEHEDGQANFFLCERFEKNDDSDWASDFEVDIDAPELDPQYNLLADDFPNWHFSLIFAYVDSQICSSLGKCISKVEINIPIAMAEHDTR